MKEQGYDNMLQDMTVEATDFDMVHYAIGREVVSCGRFSQVQDDFKELWIPVESLHLVAAKENAQAFIAGKIRAKED